MLPTRSQRSRKRSLAPPRARRPEELFLHGSNTPFGKVTADGDVEQPVQWSSEYHAPELALVYYNFLYYNPADGRWTRRDPLPIKLNTWLYTYANNSPIMQIDVRGLFFPIGSWDIDATQFTYLPKCPKDA